jgi:hypothetical protein
MRHRRADDGFPWRIHHNGQWRDGSRPLLETHRAHTAGQNRGVRPPGLTGTSG